MGDGSREECTCPLMVAMTAEVVSNEATTISRQGEIDEGPEKVVSKCDISSP